MVFSPKLQKYSYHLKTIDSHTMGESTRIVYDGFPKLKGETMMEKKMDLIEHYDFLRSSLMLEPRGHRDMFGAVLTEPVHDEADVGVIFLDSGGCLNMCGHGSIGVASMLVETEMVPVKEPYTEVVLDAPSGVIRTKIHVVNHKAVEVSILNVPAFLYKSGLSVETKEWGKVEYDISFGGSFFALVDAEKIGLSLEMYNIEKITDLGMELMKKINQSVEIHHPYLDISTVDLVEFYIPKKTAKADMKNCVIFGSAQADRSPCGTGTSAKLAALYAKGELSLHEPFLYESITGSVFRGEVIQEVEISDKKAVIPQITGSAYITGLNEWIVDEDDPLRKGFLLGMNPNENTESVRSQIVRTAWKVFRDKGYEKTEVGDIVAAADISEEEFYQYFQSKEDFIHTISELFDAKYAQLMISMNHRMSQYEKLLYLNNQLFSMIETELPFDLVRRIYIGEQSNQHELLNKERLYYKIIQQIILQGQKTEEFILEDSADKITEDYASLERGIIYDWCVKEGKESLLSIGQRFLPLYITHLLRGKEVRL